LARRSRSFAISVSGSIAAQQTFNVDAIPEFVTCANITADGNPDMIVASSGTSFISLLKNYGEFIITGDATGDGRVNVDDLIAVISNWGPCKNCMEDMAPLNDGSGTVNVDDLMVVVENWTG
jgi:hypothetical protein